MQGKLDWVLVQEKLVFLLESLKVSDQDSLIDGAGGKEGSSYGSSHTGDLLRVGFLANLVE